MGACSECDGTGVCHNDIHHSSDVDDEVMSSDVADEDMGEAPGFMHICPDCKEEADDPGACFFCGGTGEIDD